MASGLHIFWSKYFGQNRVLNPEGCFPQEIIVVKQSTRSETVVSLGTEPITMNTKTDNQDEIIKKLKMEMEKFETRKQQELERRIEHLENVTEGFSMN